MKPPPPSLPLALDPTPTPSAQALAAEPCALDCPVARTARLIDGRWTTLIIRDLLGGTRRYSALLRSLTGISPKVLAARLRFLEDEGVLLKTTYPEVPPRTEYRLSEKGRRLVGVIQAMAAYGEGLGQAPMATPGPGPAACD